MQTITPLLILAKASSQRGYAVNSNNSAYSNVSNSQQRDGIKRGDNVSSLMGDDRDLWSSETGVSIETLYDVVKNSPEVVGILTALIQDILSDGYVFKGSEGAKRKSEKFDKDAEFYKALSDSLWDVLITGDGFILKLAFSQDEIKRVVSQRIHNLEFGEPINKDVFAKDLANQILVTDSRTRGVQVLKSSSIRIIKDEFGNVKNYVQKDPNGKKDLFFSPDDIIHLHLTNVGGSTYGFTPLQSLLSDIGTLIYAKDFASKMFENDGSMARIFNFPESSGEDDRNVQFMIDQLRELRKQKNKLRPIVTTGKFEVTDLKNMASDLQFKELIDHFTTLILMAWGMPVHRVPLIIPKTTSDPAKSDEAYFRGINHKQMILEAQINKGLWKEFNSELYFNRSYRIDELREANINAIMFDRNAMTIEEGRDRLGLEPELPKDGTLPIDMKRGVYTAFNEQKDRNAEQGKFPQENNNEPGTQDNKVR